MSNNDTVPSSDMSDSDGVVRCSGERFNERLDELQGLLTDKLIKALAAEEVSPSILNVARLLLKDHDYVTIDNAAIQKIGLEFSEEELQDIESTG